MATNVSSLRVAIRGDVSGLEASLARGQKSVTSFQRKFEQTQRRSSVAVNSLGLSSGQASLAVSQLGFAVEDAVVSFGNQGLGGALRAAGNNLSFVASMLNPMAGLVVGVGTALGAILIPKLFETGEAAKDSTTDLQKWKEQLEDIDRVTAASKFFASDRPRAAADLVGANVDTIQGRIADEQFTLQGLQEQLRGAQAKRAAVLRGKIPDFLIDTLGQPTSLNRFPSLGAIAEQRRTNPDLVPAIDQATFDQLKKIDNEIYDLGQAAREAAVRVKDAREALGPAVDRQVQEEIAKQNAAALDAATRSAEEESRLANLRNSLTGTTSTSRTSQGLAGGFEFGSREAVSTLNRAMFRAIGEKKEEKEIAKNTQDAARALASIDRKTVGRTESVVVAGEPV